MVEDVRVDTDQWSRSRDDSHETAQHGEGEQHEEHEGEVNLGRAQSQDRASPACLPEVLGENKTQSSLVA